MRVSKSWSVLFLGFVLFDPSAHAGRGVDSSGGGNAIVCFDHPAIASRLRHEKLEGSGFIADSDISHITSVELLDVHKAKIPSIPMGGEMVPVTPRVIEARPGETPTQYSARLKRRFENYFPGIIHLLSEGQSFFKSIKPYAHGLTSIDDVNSVENFSTETCVKATIIAQYYEPAGNYIAYDARIFALPLSVFPASDRALSYWHEYLYFLAKKNRGAQSSDSTQTLLGALITEGVTLKEFMSLVDVTVSWGAARENYVSQFVNQVSADLKEKSLETSDLHPVYYDVSDKQGAFESSQSVIDRVQKAAKADPRYKSIQAAALRVYDEKWKSVLYATPQIPREIISLLDAGITQRLKNTEPLMRCGWWGDLSSYWCRVEFRYNVTNVGNDKPYSAVFDVALPNGDEL
jgi:hypothetical protein